MDRLHGTGLGIHSPGDRGIAGATRGHAEPKGRRTDGPRADAPGCHAESGAAQDAWVLGDAREFFWGVKAPKSLCCRDPPWALSDRGCAHPVHGQLP